ncbi:MAG: hypothetical protein QF805_17705, partial [Pirellulaceae bacterium]|nr:hypothetical protein [Pirellulaceae bacterium]
LFLIVITVLPATYLGCWQVTKRWGLGPAEYDVSLAIDEDGTRTATHNFDSSPAPFVLRRQRQERRASENGFRQFREYHLWFFGHTVKLFDRETAVPLPN